MGGVLPYGLANKRGGTAKRCPIVIISDAHRSESGGEGGELAGAAHGSGGVGGIYSRAGVDV